MFKQTFYTAFLIIGDIFALISSFALAILVRDEVIDRLIPSAPPQTFSLTHYLDFWWIPLIWLLALGFEGLYNQHHTLWDEVQRLWKAITLATVVIFAIIALGKLSPWFSRATLVLNWVFLLPLMPLSRLLVKRLLFHLGLGRRDALILGAAETGKLALKALNREPLLGYRVVGFLDDDPQKRGEVVGASGNELVRVIGTLSEAEALLKQGVAQDVIIAMPGLSEEQLIPMIRGLQNSADQIRIVPNLWGLPAMSPEVDHFMYNHLFMLTLPRSLLTPWGQLIKRSVDIVLSGLFLVILSPLFALIALAIKLDSRGPVLFRWHIAGRHGQPFVSYKFRTMHENADEMKDELLDQNEMRGPVFKIRRDPRVTRVGRVLRKFSIDEFPQLWSVLKGDMSLVGPRPPLLYEYEQFEEWQKRKLDVKPGMISLWHISGKPHDFDEWVRLDLEYIDRWSLWLDLKILLLGIPYLMLGKGEDVTVEEEAEPSADSPSESEPESPKRDSERSFQQ